MKPTVALLLFAAEFGEALKVQLRGGSPCKLVIFEHDNFQGKNAVFSGPGVIEFEQFTQVVPNDAVSSLRVEGIPTCRARLYQNADQSGWRATFGPGDYNLAKILQLSTEFKDDDASSAEIFFMGKRGLGL